MNKQSKFKQVLAGVLFSFVFITSCQKSEPVDDEMVKTPVSIAELKAYFAELTRIDPSKVVFDERTLIFSYNNVGLDLKTVEELYLKSQEAKRNGEGYNYNTNDTVTADSSDSISNHPVAN